MITLNSLEKILGAALATGGDWSDIFVEETVKNHVQLSDRRLKNIARQQLAGAGIRVVSNQKEYYAYTNDLSERGLAKAAREVADAVSREPGEKKISLEDRSVPPVHSPRKDVKGAGWEEKIALVRRADEECRSISDKIIQVNADYIDEVQQIVIANSDGLFRQDRRTRGRFSLNAVAGEGNERQAGYESPGAHRGFEFFEELDLKKLSHDAAETALRMLTADYAPQGRMTVIIDAGFGGVIFHEACGHSLEASAVAKKATVFAESLGKQIASPHVSAVDDGTLAREWGSATLDDEGNLTRRNLLIENGILKSFLVDRLNGERIGLPSTGSSRRQSYRYAPTSRMNNTFILPGKDTLEEMIADTDDGLYARKMGGGSVNPATGEFNFAVSEGYLIKNGKIAAPVRGAVLIGRGDEILQKIDRVGSELRLAQGMCGAASGWVPVNVGQPAIRVRDILVGGRSGTGA